jgi:hypothetical protein
MNLDSIGLVKVIVLGFAEHMNTLLVNPLAVGHIIIGPVLFDEEFFEFVLVLFESIS